MKKLLFAGVAFAAAVGWYFWYSAGETAAQQGLTVPQYSALEQQGEVAFNGTCAECHGVNMVGTDKGPTLLHQFYVPGHHSDMSIVMAVQRGTRQHHWRFGDMPAQSHITDDDLVSIIAYVRALQRANGIE